MKMKRILWAVFAALLIIVLAAFLVYSGLYSKQISYIKNLLDREVRIAGSSVDGINNEFASDLNQILFSEDLSLFFTDPAQRAKIEEKIRFFFTRYETIVTGIKFFDSNRNGFTLKKDETGENWLIQNFVLHSQGEIIARDELIRGPRGYEYYLPVLKNGTPIGNFVVSIDFSRYFDYLFSGFSASEYQWQWVVSDSGSVIYDNSGKPGKYSRIDRLTRLVAEGASENIVHSYTAEGNQKKIITSFYATQLLQKEIGLMFSASADTFRTYILIVSLTMALLSIMLIAGIAWLFRRHIKSLEERSDRLKASEEMLFRMIDSIPAGVIIYNGNREIMMANREASKQFSYGSETEMKGRIYPGNTYTDESGYYLKNLAGTFGPEQFVIVRKEIGELILYRNTIPVSFQGEDARLDILFDVTMMESARQQAARANTAKSEFLARMSYELRTPLNGIIGMSDILTKRRLAAEDRAVVSLLRQSAEVLLNIVNDVLDFSKIESGKMILDEIPFSLREEILYCYDLARTNIDEKHVKLACSVDEEVPDNLIGDPYRLRQILTNLLNHSVESTARGSINLKCGLAEKNNGAMTLRFELTDTGKSFDRATIKKIFGDHVNIESKVHGDDDGSGFGTILARQLTGLMGGEFNAESPSGLDGDKGLRINFTISLNLNETVVKNLQFDNITSFGEIRTLVISGGHGKDEEILNSLYKLGLTVSVTTYQKSTINQLIANLSFPDKRYHLLVIADNGEFSGFTVARDLWDNNLTGRFIIMIISSNDTRGNLLKCINLGVDNYIVKPFEIGELFEKIRSKFRGTDIQPEKRETESGLRNIRILVVEDNKLNQKVLGTMLKSLGYSFDFADDGFAGLIQAKTRKYDVIFMDLLMPRMDGYEAAQKILEYDSSQLIVAFTADNMPDSKRKAELAGIKEFISKPVRIDDLREFFRKHFFKN